MKQVLIALAAALAAVLVFYFAASALGPAHGGATGGRVETVTTK